MSVQTIGVGSVANDGTGDPLRTAFTKVNANFTEAYGAPTALYSGAQMVAARGQTSGAGDVVVYTVPSGKRATVTFVAYYNTSGGSITQGTFAKSGGTNYRLTTDSAVTASAAGSTFPIFVLEAGESFVINATGSGLNYTAAILEYDDAVRVLSPRVLGPSTGDNVVYTVPAGFSAFVMSSTFSTGPSGSATFRAWNGSGGTRTLNLYHVPSGGSVGTSNRFVVQSVGNGGIGSLMCPVGLGAGDSLVCNVDTGSASMLLWITVREIPVP